MIGLLATMIASAGIEAHQPRIQSSAVACRLAHKDRIPRQTQYSIAGHYFSDGMHGSELDIPRCKEVIFPMIAGDASNMIAAFHDAFREKCGGTLVGDSVTGIFTGRFVRRKAQLFGMSEPTMTNFFEISRIDSKDLDADSIKCPK